MELWEALKESHSSSPEKDFLRDVGRRNLTDRLSSVPLLKIVVLWGEAVFPKSDVNH